MTSCKALGSWAGARPRPVRYVGLAAERTGSRCPERGTPLVGRSRRTWGDGAVGVRRSEAKATSTDAADQLVRTADRSARSPRCAAINLCSPGQRPARRDAWAATCLLTGQG